jgi:hypothetical protein
MNWLLRRKYLTLLLALVLLLAVYPVLRGFTAARFLFDAMYTVVFICALLVLSADRRLRLLACLLAVPTLLGAWTHYVLPDLPRPPLLIGFHLAAAVFFLFVLASILRAIFREEAVSQDSIYGAFCGYLLIGVTFGHLYCALETVLPGSYQGSGRLTAQFDHEEGLHFLLTYFSLATLTTVAYGDITPASDPARSLAVIEAIGGQFYMAVLIAQLIGKRVAQVLSGPR